MDQSFEAIEVIVVNDGSNDSTKDQLEHLAKEHPSLIIINQQNQGVSTARNNGIQAARGTFIGFVDADDFVEPNFVDSLVQPMLNLDLDWTVVGVSQFHTDKEDQKSIRRSFAEEHVKSINENDEFVLRFISGEFDFANWNKLYKAKIISDYDIRFVSSLSIGEDLVFNLEYLSQAKSVLLLKSNVYNYRIQDDSLSHSPLKNQWSAYCQRTHTIETKCASQRIKISQVARRKLISEQTVFSALPMLLKPQLHRLSWNQFRRMLSFAAPHWFQPPDRNTSPSLRFQLFLLRNKFWYPLYLRWKTTIQ